MATTGFWPVKGNLKSVIVYAENPDKTMNPKFFDSDLYVPYSTQKTVTKLTKSFSSAVSTAQNIMLMHK